MSCFLFAGPSSVVRRAVLLLLCCGHAACAVVDDAGSFSWWRVSRILILSGELITLKAGGRLDPITNIISIDSVNRV